MRDRDRKAEDEGRKAQEQGGSWRDNPHRPGTRDYYAYEDGRRDAGAKDVGPAPGTPSWG
jgi:hypothetical protein